MAATTQNPSALRVFTATPVRAWVLCVCFLIAGLGVGVPAAWGQAPAFCVDPKPVFTLGSSLPGESPSHQLTFDIQAGELQIFKALLTYPPEFVFNGFGAAGTPVGTMYIDPGTGEVPVPVIALGPEAAFVDLNNSGARAYWEPTLACTGGSGSPLQCKVIAYFGGDNDPTTHSTPISTHRRVVLNAGIFTNPAAPGTYVAGGVFTSVDPDTGGADDGQDPNHPATCNFNLAVKIRKQVVIDIKPGSYPNCFNNDGHGVIPVAILSSADFDATQVDPDTVELDGQAVRVVGKKGNVQAHVEDANADGLNDLVVQIEDTDGTYQQGTGTATLTGETTGGVPFIGTDSICVTQ